MFHLYIPYASSVIQRGVWGLLLWPYILTVSMPLDCKEEPGSLTRCPSISQEKLLDRVIHHAELIYRVSEESCSLFVSNSKINLCSFTFLMWKKKKTRANKANKKKPQTSFDCSPVLLYSHAWKEYWRSLEWVIALNHFSH